MHTEGGAHRRRSEFPIIALVLGIIIGDWLGYYHAYRGEKAIGSMIRIAFFKASPEGISQARARRAAELHDTRFTLAQAQPPCPEPPLGVALSVQGEGGKC